jgi:16S rRNA (guanine966-N2)-methyltransferase
LAAPPGKRTRPTADRVRQALFDMLTHATWGGAEAIAGARVVDAFAGSGALGLEALSRGAAQTTFMEIDAAALSALRTNVAALGVAARTCILASDARLCPPGDPATLILLDPPYGEGLVREAFCSLRARRWIAEKALVVAEIRRTEPVPALGELLSERLHGAARLVIWRAPGRDSPP